MKQWCEKLGIFVGISGTIGSLFIAYLYGNEIDVSTSYKVTSVRDWPLTIGIFLGCMASVVVLTTILISISYILGKLEEIQYSISTISENQSQDEEPSYSYWTCACGQKNPNYTGTCSCGRSKNNK